MFQQDIDTLEAAIKVASEDYPEGMAVIQLKLSISLLRARFFRELSTLQIHLVHGAFSDVQTQKRVLSLFTKNKVSRSHGANDILFEFYVLMIFYLSTRLTAHRGHIAYTE